MSLRAPKWNSVTQKRSKYRNKKVEIDGHKFDSKKEASRYVNLKLLERAGNISKLELQPRFTLQDSFVDSSGATHKRITYVADFSYLNKDGKMVIEDTKGFSTDVYRIKKKMFLKMYPDYVFIEG